MHHLRLRPKHTSSVSSTSSSRSRSGDDAGFTLIEVVIAMAIFTTLAGSVLGLIVKAQGLNADSLRRNAATNLASQAIEAVRDVDLAAASDPLPFGTSSWNQLVGKITYTVTRQVAPASAAGNTSVCGSGSSSTIAYKRVTVTVTWPDRRPTTNPVRADTLRAVGFGTDNTVTGGTVAIAVTGPDGALAGMNVTLSSSSPVQSYTAVSGSDGCAVFTGLTGSAYTATVSVPNYVGFSGSVMGQSVSTSVSGLSDGALVRGTLTYALARSVTVNVNPPSGTFPPTTLIGTVTGSLGGIIQIPPYCATGATVACLTAVPGTLKWLYPDTYTLLAGTCPGTGSAPSSLATASVTSAMSAAAVLNLGSVTSTVKYVGNSQPVSGRTVTFTRVAQTGESCTGPEVYTATTTASGTVTYALPYGQWQMTVPNVGSNVTGAVLSATVITSPAARSATVNLKVVA